MKNKKDLNTLFVEKLKYVIKMRLSHLVVPIVLQKLLFLDFSLDVNFVPITFVRDVYFPMISTICDFYYIPCISELKPILALYHKNI